MVMWGKFPEVGRSAGSLEKTLELFINDAQCLSVFCTFMYVHTTALDG